MAVNKTREPSVEEFKLPSDCDQIRWKNWFETDILAQIQSMLHDDAAFQSLSQIVNECGHHGETPLHNPMVWRALSQGYTATQYLYIRRLTDKGYDEDKDAEKAEKRKEKADREVVSLWRLLKDIERTYPECKFIKALEDRIDPEKSSELSVIKRYTNKCVAHTADRYAEKKYRDSNKKVEDPYPNRKIDIPLVTAIEAVQREIVFVAQVVSYFFLGNRAQIEVMPPRPEAFLNLTGIPPTALSKARKRWAELYRKRNNDWTACAIEWTKSTF
jgi:hypothetical protein